LGDRRLVHAIAFLFVILCEAKNPGILLPARTAFREIDPRKV
jgi:hypothetical protein